MDCIALVRCVLVLRCGLAGVVWCGIRIPQQISRKLLRMDVLTSETCWALNIEIIKQVTSSWSLFIQLWRSFFILCNQSGNFTFLMLKKSLLYHGVLSEDKIFLSLCLQWSDVGRRGIAPCSFNTDTGCKWVVSVTPARPTALERTSWKFDCGARQFPLTVFNSWSWRKSLTKRGKQTDIRCSILWLNQ